MNQVAAGTQDFHHGKDVMMVRGNRGDAIAWCDMREAQPVRRQVQGADLAAEEIERGAAAAIGVRTAGGSTTNNTTTNPKRTDMEAEAVRTGMNTEQWPEVEALIITRTWLSDAAVRVGAMMPQDAMMMRPTMMMMPGMR